MYGVCVYVCFCLGVEREMCVTLLTKSMNTKYDSAQWLKKRWKNGWRQQGIEETTTTTIKVYLTTTSTAASLAKCRVYILLFYFEYHQVVVTHISNVCALEALAYCK